MTEARAHKIDGAIVGLVLAAGASTRMGAARNKLLERVGGRPLVAWPVAALSATTIESVFVVLGHEAANVRAALVNDEDNKLRFVTYFDWARGVGDSIAFGVESILAAGSPSGIVISVGDLPGLRPSIVKTLLAAFAQYAEDNAICLPEHAGRDGHPVIFGRAHFNALRQLSGDRGARGLVEAHTENVHRVPVDTDAILRDVDTPAALESWQD